MKPSDASQDDRLRAMEERITFQQQTMDDLHEVVLQQQRQLDTLHREQVRLAALLGRLSDLTAGDLPHEKPPHY